MTVLRSVLCSNFTFAILSHQSALPSLAVTMPFQPKSWLRPGMKPTDSKREAAHQQCQFKTDIEQSISIKMMADLLESFSAAALTNFGFDGAVLALEHLGLHRFCLSSVAKLVSELDSRQSSTSQSVLIETIKTVHQWMVTSIGSVFGVLSSEKPLRLRMQDWMSMRNEMIQNCQVCFQSLPQLALNLVLGLSIVYGHCCVFHSPYSYRVRILSRFWSHMLSAASNRCCSTRSSIRSYLAFL